MTNDNYLDKLPAPPNNKTSGDYILSITKAGLGSIPIAGSAFTEALQLAVSAPAEKRLAIWLGLVQETINKLIEEIDSLTPEKLGENDAFVTAVISTTRAAMLTERREKLEILRSVLHTTGTGYTLHEVLRNTYLATIDRYTAEHILLLYRCSNADILIEAFKRFSVSRPEYSSEARQITNIQIEKLVPEVLSEVTADIAKEIFSDLHRDGFVNGSNGFVLNFNVSNMNKVSTVRGTEFLRFIFGPSGASEDWHRRASRVQ